MHVISVSFDFARVSVQEEANAATEQQQQLGSSDGVVKGGSAGGRKTFMPRDALMARANSLKKAVRNVLDLTEKEVDAQVEVTAETHTLMQPVHEEPGIQTSPNLSPYSSQSSIDSGQPSCYDMGPQSLDLGTHSRMYSEPQGGMDSGPRSLDLNLRESGRISADSTTHGRVSLSSHGSVVDPVP